MATGPLSIKLRCASWQQLATIYKHDLSRGAMFLKASNPPAIGTEVQIDLTLPSGSVIALTGVVEQHLTDPQRGAGVELKLEPLPAQSVWLIESALVAESKRRKTPPAGVPVVASTAPASPSLSISEGEEVSAAEQDLIKALIAEAESLKKLNPFLVLGVGYEATDADVRTAFGELTKRYHPDLFARYQSTQLRQLAAEIFILIRDAYRRLGDETGRAQALGSLGRTPAPRAVPNRAPTPAPVPVGPPPRPSTRPASAQPQPPPPIARTESQPIPKIREPELIPLEPPVDNPTVKPQEPMPIPREAQRTTPPPAHPAAAPRPAPVSTVPMPQGTPTPRPTAPAVSAARVDAPAASPPDRKPVPGTPALTETSDTNPVDDLIEQGKLDEAIVAAKVMAKKHPSDRSSRAAIEVCEGLRALGARDRLEAAQRFEAALEIDPSNERAARELAEMRRQATNERKGLLTRLMGKKE